MSLTTLLSIAGILIAFVWSIIKWRIVRGAKQAGKDEQALEQMQGQAEDYKKTNQMAEKEDREMYERLQESDGVDGLGAGSWVPDRRDKTGK